MKYFLVLCFADVILSINVYVGESYKPVILMHGIKDGAEVFVEFSQFIQKVHPGTNVTAITVDSGWRSILKPMWTQVRDVIDAVTPIMKEHPGGVHLIGYSQGGLVSRGVLQSMPDHNIENFISLSSPQAGQYGGTGGKLYFVFDTSAFKYIFPQFIKSEMYRFFYTQRGQENAVGNYWNDPHHQELYLNVSVFLPILNNQTFNNRSQEFKDNFTKIKNLILIGGPQDGVITPWQSSHFAAYNETEDVVEMKQQEWYTKDWFGLQTLDRRGSLHTYEQRDIEHHHWVKNFTVFQKYIEPWLT